MAGEEKGEIPDRADPKGSHEEQQAISVQKKSGWDKLDIILKPVGGLLTALAVAVVGLLASAALDRRQALDTNFRLYAELMSKREESDSLLRKDMFNSIIRSFLTPKSTGPAEKVLNLELLTYNFHEALDLGPLFKHVYKQVADSHDPHAEEYLHRLDKAATEMTYRQIAALEEAGGKLDGAVDLQELKDRPEGVPAVIDSDLQLQSKDNEDLDAISLKRHFRVDVLGFDLESRELRVSLEVKTSRATGGNNEDPEAAHAVFRVGFFDFPMIDNFRLSLGQRCAIVMRDFDPGSAEELGSASISVIFFPADRASLKEKLFYDEVIHNLLYTKKPEASGVK